METWKYGLIHRFTQVRPEDGKPLSEFRKPKRDKALSDFAVEIENLLNKKEKAEAVETRGLKKQKPDKISLSRLPTTGEKFFGRKEEIKALDAAWEDEHTHIVTLIAWGGVGKSALVNHWLNLVERKNYCGAQRVYGWSFYSQGAEEGKQASADEFMHETLTWFGDPKPEDGSAVEKGRRLARLVREQRTLLILDGMEPLQYPPGEVHGFDGKLKDQGLKTLLKELAGGHPGLCVITSREPVTDIAHKKEFTVKEIELEHLSTEAGMQLLKGLGGKGSDKEMAKAVEEYKGHALALTLLGRYIKKVYDGDIRKRDKIPLLAGRDAHADSSDFIRALDYLNRAVTGLRESGNQDDLPRGLLARAQCYRLMNQFSKAWDDLGEAEEIAELGSMKLHLCDYHLEAGRLSEAEGKKEQADHHFSIAKGMIEETGYFRRSEMMSDE